MKRLGQESKPAGSKWKLASFPDTMYRAVHNEAPPIMNNTTSRGTSLRLPSPPYLVDLLDLADLLGLAALVDLVAPVDLVVI